MMMRRGFWLVALLLAFGLCLKATDGLAKTLSKEEVEALWEQRLRTEQYKAIQYLNRKYTTPTDDMELDEKEIIVTEGREAYLMGILWDVRRRGMGRSRAIGGGGVPSARHSATVLPEDQILASRLYLD